MFLEKFKTFPQFEPILRPISGISPKFDYATLCVLNRSLVSQKFRSQILFLSKGIEEKRLGGGWLDPPLNQEGLSNYK